MACEATCKACDPVTCLCDNPHCKNSVGWQIDKYTEQLSQAKSSFDGALRLLLPLLTCAVSSKNTIFLTGIGKSGHVVKKAIATWQSFGIPAQYILIQDMFHGDLGVLRDGDFLIYVTNSGSTEEIMSVSKYVKTNFDVTQVAITTNSDAPLKAFVESSVSIYNHKIDEADRCDLAPTVSAVIFMVFLDLLGIKLSEYSKFSEARFKKFHPGGALGAVLNSHHSN